MKDLAYGYLISVIFFGVPACIYCPVIDSLYGIPAVIALILTHAAILVYVFERVLEAYYSRMMRMAVREMTE